MLFAQCSNNTWQIVGAQHLFIKYNHEVLYGEEINALMSWEDEVSHHNFNDGSTQIEIHWGKI